MVASRSDGLRRAAGAIACAALLSLGAGAAGAQEIEPNEFVPLPEGTNLAIGYYVYGHDQDYNVARGPIVGRSGLEVNVGLLRLVHYTTLFGQPAGFQAIEAFGSESAGHIGGERLGSAVGAANTTFSAFVWPYADFEAKRYLIVNGFINPPVGTYDKYAALNLAGAATGSVGWTGDGQVGWDQGIGENFSFDLAFDARAFGDVTGPGGTRTSKDADFRLQAWANWNWSRSFQTAIGWESILGGASTTNGRENGAKGEFERVRAAASQFLAPNFQVLLELNHDFVGVGGFKQVFGATGRAVFVF